MMPARPRPMEAKRSELPPHRHCANRCPSKPVNPRCALQRTPAIADFRRLTTAQTVATKTELQAMHPQSRQRNCRRFHPAQTTSVFPGPDRVPASQRNKRRKVAKVPIALERQAVIEELETLRSSSTAENLQPDGIEVVFIAALLHEQLDELKVPAASAYWAAVFD